MNQEMVESDTHDPLEDFPNISEQIQIPTKSLHKYFTHETCPFNMQRRPQNPDESKTSINIDRLHNFSQNRGHIILAIPREPITNRGAIPINLSHRGTPDKFISDDEILELLTHVRHNPTTHLQHEKKIGPTTKTRLPTCSNL